MKVPPGDYDLESFCEAILNTSEANIFEDLHVHQIKIIPILKASEDWVECFEDYESEKFGEVIKLSKSYQTRVGETREAVFFAGEYGDRILMILTGAVEDAIRQTLDVTQTHESDIEPMPIFPADFQEMNDYILSSYPDMKISEFKAIRHPELTDAEIRPEIEEREIEYRAIDGRETLKEFGEYYGVVPVRVQYKHENIQFKMDTDGKFTLSSINDQTFNLFFELIERVVDEIIRIQEVTENIRFRTETRRSGEVDIQVPRLSSGRIQFEQEFDLLTAEQFMNYLSDHDTHPYTFSDMNKQAGSLDLSARVTDERRGSQFNISSSADAMTIIPKQNCSWGSIMKFYHHFSQAVDNQSQLKLFSDFEDHQAS